MADQVTKSRPQLAESRVRKSRWRNFMSKRVIGIALSAMLFALSFPAEAQQQQKLAKIGWLQIRPPNRDAGLETFRRELRALGYVEGQNISFESRSAENKPDRLPALAENLVRLKVDVLLTASANVALAAKRASRTIPIVFISVSDPVGDGLVDSLARPGGNITGFTTNWNRVGW
jgi:putative ABC transport system substrate-binding protein